MNSQQVEFFVSEYSRMSDEELAYLIATRRKNLSEEAVSALEIVLKQRDLSTFQTELRATTADVDAQAEYARREAEERKERKRLMRRTIHIMSLIALVAGLLFLGLGRSEVGTALCAMGAGLFLYYELNRLFWRFIAGLFRTS